MMPPPKLYLVIHHSATKDSGTVSWGAVRKYHVETNGWADIGYHIGFEDVGGHVEALAGRPMLAKAAAVKEGSWNAAGFHACFVGDYDAAEPSVAMIEYAARHLRDICYALAIPMDRTHIIGHREAIEKSGIPAYKTCPGKLFPIDTLVAKMKTA